MVRPVNVVQSMMIKWFYLVTVLCYCCHGYFRLSPIIAAVVMLVFRKNIFLENLPENFPPSHHYAVVISAHLFPLILRTENS